MQRTDWNSLSDEAFPAEIADLLRDRLLAIVEAVRQLRGGLGERQVQGAEVALVPNEAASCRRTVR